MKEPQPESKRLETIQETSQPATSGSDNVDGCGGSNNDGAARIDALPAPAPAPAPSQVSDTLPRLLGPDASTIAPFRAPDEPSSAVTTATTASGTTDSSNSDPRWDRAVQLLNDHPHLVTRELLCAALQHNPPADVVRLLLRHDSGLASYPRLHLLLHLALVNRCRTGAIQALLEKCPGSCLKVKARFPVPSRTNDSSSSKGETKEEGTSAGNIKSERRGDETASFELLDPLSYVQKYRPEDTVLIDILRRATEEGEEEGPATSRSTRPVINENSRDGDPDAGSTAASASALTLAASNRHHSLPVRSDGEAAGREDAARRPPSLLSASSVSLPSSSKPLSLMNLCVSGATTLWHENVAASPEAQPYPSGSTPTGLDGDRRRHRASEHVVAASLPARADRGPVVATHHHCSSRRPAYLPNEEEELVNMKRLCTAVVKGHRKLTQRMDELTRSTVESSAASEERVLTVLQAELTHRDNVTSAALTEWHDLLMKEVQDAVSVVRKAAKKREDELVQRLSALERQVQAYEMFRSFEADPPPETGARRDGKKEWIARLGASRTAATLTATTSNLDGSFDDSWTTRDAAPSSFTRGPCEDADDEANLFMWTSHEERSSDFHANWLGRYVFENEVKVDDAARSLLSDDGMEGWSYRRPVKVRDKASHRRHRDNRNRQVKSCLVWLLPRSPAPPIQRWIIAVKSGTGKLCMNPVAA